MLVNFLNICDHCVKREAIQQITSIFLDLSVILNFVSMRKKYVNYIFIHCKIDEITLVFNY